MLAGLRMHPQPGQHDQQLGTFTSAEMGSITSAVTMANHLRTGLVLGALNMALHQRRPASVIHHSDSEYMRAGSLA